MRKTIALSLALLLLLSGCGLNLSKATLLRRYSDGEKIDRAEALVRAFYEQSGLMGISVALVEGDTVRFINIGHTESGGAPVSENSFYEIASLTNTFTGILLGSLEYTRSTVLPEYQSSYLSLNDPVQKWFPNNKVPDFNGEPMLIWQLACHVSGLPFQPDNFSGGENPYAEYSELDLKKYLISADLESAPGTEYRYSDLGFGLLGHTLSNAGKAEYLSLVQSRILTPLRMYNTTTKLTAQQELRRAKPHDAFGNPVSQWDYAALVASGGLKSTAYDMALYVSGNLGALPTDVALSTAIETAHTEYFSDEQGRRLGLGFVLSALGDRQVLWHDGASGGYGSFMGLIPESNVGVVVLTNNAVAVADLGFALLQMLEP